MSMGIKKVLLGLGLFTAVSALGGMAVANAKPAPADDDQAKQECPEGEKCDRPAADHKKLKKGEERNDDAAPEGKAPRKAKHEDERDSGKAMNDRPADADRDAPRDEQKQSKDHKKKPPKPTDDEDQDQ